MFLKISQNSQENTLPNYSGAFFSYESCETFKNMFFNRTHPLAVSVYYTENCVNFCLYYVNLFWLFSYLWVCLAEYCRYLLIGAPNVGRNWQVQWGTLLILVLFVKFPVYKLYRSSHPELFFRMAVVKISKIPHRARTPLAIEKFSVNWKKSPLRVFYWKFPETFSTSILEKTYKSLFFSTMSCTVCTTKSLH